MTTIGKKLGKGIFVSAAAATLAFGALGAGVSDASAFPLFGSNDDEAEECEADRSNHLLGGLLTDELTFVSDLLPFTIAGEQFPVCDDEDAS